MPEQKKQQSTKDEETPEQEAPKYAQGETADSEVVHAGTAIAPRDLGRRYRVLSGGLTGAGGASYSRGDIVDAEQLGDAARVAKLLERRSIELAP